MISSSILALIAKAGGAKFVTHAAGGLIASKGGGYIAGTYLAPKAIMIIKIIGSSAAVTGGTVLIKSLVKSILK